MTEKDKKQLPDRMQEDGVGLVIESLGEGEEIDFSHEDDEADEPESAPKKKAS